MSAVFSYKVDEFHKAHIFKKTTQMPVTSMCGFLLGQFLSCPEKTTLKRQTFFNFHETAIALEPCLFRHNLPEKNRLAPGPYCHGSLIPYGEDGT